MSELAPSDVADRVVLVDPLSLLGREILELLPQYPAVASRLAFVHTDEDEEHQIAEIAGTAALVPPLGDALQLSGCAAVVVTRATGGPRLEHVAAFLEGNPMLPLVDVARRPELRALTRPVAKPRSNGGGVAVRVAPPAAVAAVLLLEPLADLGPGSVSLAVVEPVSQLGRDGVETLARQAATRLSGGTVTELIDNEILAFNAISAPDEDLAEDLALLLGHADVAAVRTRAGFFHGHQTMLGVRFADPVSPGDLTERWSLQPELALLDGPLRLDRVADEDRVLLAQPHVSGDGRTVAIAAAVDGLRVGGARTAMEILQQLL